MDRLIVVLEQDPDPRLRPAAESVAPLLDAHVSTLHVPATLAYGDRAELVVQTLDEGGVAGAAISARGTEPVLWDVITRVTCPVLVLPRRGPDALREVTRVLLPLDGAPETAAAVAGVADRAVTAGATVVAVHVFDALTVPAFWDQAAHTHQHWTREFLRRNLPGEVELDLRSGRPAEEVLMEADESGADLVVVAWAQELGGGRARTVRRALTEGSTPVLLVSAARDIVPRARDLPPSAPPPGRAGLEA